MKNLTKDYILKKFSLMELLVVLGILAVLITLILPNFNNIDEDVKRKVAITEMQEIRKAFQRFASDVIFRQEIRPDLNGLPENSASNKKLYDIALYGLWPLLCKEHPVLKSNDAGFLKYEIYDAEKRLGRSGPYLEIEDWVQIFPVTITNAYGPNSACGQENCIISTHGAENIASGTNRRIPVIRDPYGGYYRVLCPMLRTDGKGNNLSEFKRLQRIILVCTGKNKILETFPNSFDDNPISPIVADEIKGFGDDITMPLLPFTGF